MLYVLTQEELDNLVPKKDLDAANAGLEWMRNKFIPMCRRNPIHKGSTSRQSGNTYWYCCGCPVSDIGGDAKTEKERPPSDISSAICPNKRRRYGK
jgi:hypothetical protein